MADLNTQGSQGFATSLSTDDAPPVQPLVATPSPVQTAKAPPTPTETTTTSQAQPAKDKATEEPQMVTPAGSGGKEKGNNRKVIATILGIILLITGVATGVYLIGQQQELREKAERVTPLTCPIQPSENTLVVNFNEKVLRANSSEDRAKNGPVSASIPSGNYKVTLVSYDDHSSKASQTQPQESYLAILQDTQGVQITTTSAISDLPESQNLLTEEVNSNLNIGTGVSQVVAFHSAYPTGNVNSIVPVCAAFTLLPPEVSAQCLNIQAFDNEWNQLTSSDLSNLSPGETVRFTVAGSASSGNFDKARFTINGTPRPEVTAQKPASDDFYDEYTIPNDVTDFTVSAQVHHTSLGWF
ncbi:MAG: hypothetical protein ACC618_00545 [Patescibacteria group bacterium]